MSEEIKGSNCPFHSIDRISKFDMLDEHARSDPWPYYDWLRMSDERRVYKVEQEDVFYVLHRFDDVKAAFVNSESLKSGIIPTKEQLFIALMDGKEHRRIRDAMSVFFQSSAIESLRTLLEAIVSDTISRALEEEKFDLIEQIAIPIAMKVLASLLGLPTHDKMAQELYESAMKINRALFVTGGTGPRRLSKPTVGEKFQITWALIKNIPKVIRLSSFIGFSGLRELMRKFSRQGEAVQVPRPNFDCIPDAIGSFLQLLILMGEQMDAEDRMASSSPWHKLQKEVQDGKATKLEMMLATSFVLFAGHETSISLISNSIVHLAKHPEEVDLLKKESERLSNFIEECLRFYTPVGRFLRRVTSDMKVGETTIPKDSIVILMPGAANTDPAKFEHACAFDLDRKNTTQHLSFGKGLHFCLGAQLARTMINATLSELLSRADRISIDDEFPQKFVTDRDNGVFRYESIGVKITEK